MVRFSAVVAVQRPEATWLGAAVLVEVIVLDVWLLGALRLLVLLLLVLGPVLLARLGRRTTLLQSGECTYNCRYPDVPEPVVYPVEPLKQ